MHAETAPPDHTEAGEVEVGWVMDLSSEDQGGGLRTGGVDLGGSHTHWHPVPFSLA